jgi:hypothetical protein
MDHEQAQNEPRAAADLGERLRTWRMFLAAVRWSAGGLALLLLLLVLILRG